jgi:hypothetical protein
MPNWCSNSLTTPVNGDRFWAVITEIARTSGKVDKYGEEDCKVTPEDFASERLIFIPDLFDWFVPLPPELKDICVGGTTINGERHTHWREVGEGDDRHNVPVTEAELLELRIRYGAADWYDWSVARWDTKWDTTADWVADSEELQFDTAWVPPRGFVQRLSEQFPETTFRLAYCEGGMGFFGVDDFRDGVMYEVDYSSEGIYLDGVNWGTLEDYDDALTPEARAHLAEYGLHTGG